MAQTIRVLSLRIVILALAVLPLAGSDAYCTGADLLRRDDAWLTGAEGATILDNILSFQTPVGGWCKAYDARKPCAGPAGGWNGVPTIDNGATWSEIRVLARAHGAQARPAYATAVQRGIDFLLARQYANGGWPQRSPLDPGRHQYGVHITFNDDAMVEVMRLMDDIARKRPPFAWLDEGRRAQADAAFTRGIDCILRSQIVVDGKPAGWCQQHDATTLAPATARAYELPSISGAESAGIALLLMSLPAPDARVRTAVDGVCSWYERARITGKRVETRNIADAPKGRDRIVVDDPSAPGMWARYYDLVTGQPFFCDRDGVKRTTLAAIGHERRNGYAWYGNWGEQVLKEYARWQAR